MLREIIEKWLAVLPACARKPEHLENWLAGVGGFIAMVAVIAVAMQFGNKGGALLVATSMGASALLLFALPHGDLSQPWNVIGGHSVSALIGVACATWVPDGLLAAALALALSMVAMRYLVCMHPPGGATALTAVLGADSMLELGFYYVVMPVLSGAVTLVAVAIVYNYLFPWRRYPATLARITRPKLPGLNAQANDERVY